MTKKQLDLVITTVDCPNKDCRATVGQYCSAYQSKVHIRRRDAYAKQSALQLAASAVLAERQEVLDILKQHLEACENLGENYTAIAFRQAIRQIVRRNQ